MSRVLFAVDPVAAVAEEALDWGADLIVTHHPLYLRGTTSVAATTPKGRLLHTLIKHDIALYTAHTNADVANPGVSDALARAVGLVGDLVPLRPFPDDPWRGLGRIGDLPAETTLGEFAERAAAGLPRTAWGDPRRRRRVPPRLRGWPSAGERATRSWPRPVPRVWTFSSRPICGTTRPASSWRRAGPR